MPTEDTLCCETCDGFEGHRKFSGACDGGRALDEDGDEIDCSECDNVRSIQVPCPEDSPHKWTQYTCEFCCEVNVDIRGDDLEAAARVAQHEAACSRNNS